jgi:hypothetical protein
MAFGRHHLSPPLTPEILDDPDALGQAIDEATATRSADAHSRRIRRFQEELRACVNDEVWMLFLHVEQAMNHRAGEEFERLVRWAFAEGYRCGRAAGHRFDRHRR